MNNLLDILKTLADETRFKIINLLLTYDLCVGALAKHLGISEAAVSQHLQTLRKVGLVKGEKRGYWTHYSVEREVLNLAAESLKNLATQVSYKYVCTREKTSTIERGEKQVCECNCKCEHPEKLKGKPEECTSGQKQECHGDEKEHSYEGKKN